MRSLLDAATGVSRIVQVVAPAGYGKTSALAEWARRQSIPVGWVSMSPLMVAPQRLFGALRAALAESDVTGAEVIRALSGAQPYSNADRLAIHAAIAGVQDEVALVLDDAHLVPDVLADGMLSLLVRHGPPNLRLLIAARTPLSGLARAILHGECTVIGPDELAFDEPEVREALTLLAGPKSGDGAAALLARTGDGRAGYAWPSCLPDLMRCLGTGVGRGSMPSSVRRRAQPSLPSASSS
ncbi:hypothetical protein [Nocardioides alcanivorans]|uniref:hypothetical protein n=1 Tax=Nocardioides alcanivorans TaxID=2897352 RepID=UPI001F460F74|nr:hypothetical protein [Nocardioides alcanivorans]